MGSAFRQIGEAWRELEPGLKTFVLVYGVGGTVAAAIFVSLMHTSP